MTLTLELTDKQARNLKIQADVRGVSLERLAQLVLQSHIEHDDSWAHLQKTDPEEWWRRFHAWAARGSRSMRSIRSR